MRQMEVFVWMFCKEIPKHDLTARLYSYIFFFFQLWRIKLIKSDIYCVLQNIIYEINAVF